MSASEAAWIAAVPCALATLAAVVLLGPVLGHAFLAPGRAVLWPPEALQGTPEPAKHGRFVVALLGPVALAAAVLLSPRAGVRLRPRAVGALVTTGQALTLGFVVLALLAQEAIVVGQRAEALWAPFRTRTLLAALAIALSLSGALHAPAALRAARRAVSWASDGRGTQAACALVAAAVAAAWLLTAVNSDATIGLAQVSDLPPWAMGDTFAILDGRTPLADFHAIYSELWGYVAAGPMAAFGAGIATFTVTMTAISGLALLLIYDLFRRLVGSPLLALALYLPFVALGFIAIGAVDADRVTNASIFSVWPMRYAGPYALAWLTARHVGGATPRRAWLLLAAAGIVLINNVEFGLGAFAGTLLAVAAARRAASWRAWLALLGEAAAGLLAAAALVALLTLVRAGSLPHFGDELEFIRIFGVLGLVAQGLPALGLHLALYVTFSAAIVVAAVRLAAREEDPVLTSMLLWSGVFGLGAAGYFLGRSDGFKLAALFSAWGLSLMLLTIVVVRSALAAEARRPRIAELTVLLGFGLSLCLLAQFPPPWSQAARLRARSPRPLYAQTDVVRFVRARTRSAEKVGILVPFGHRIAYELGLVNVSPYIMDQTVVTRPQWQAVLDAMARERARELFLTPSPAPALRRLLTRAGYAQRAAGANVVEWVRS